MLSEPKLGFHPEQPYAAIVSVVKPDEIAAKLPPLIGEVRTWLEKNKIKAGMPPFFRYQAWSNLSKFEVAVGFPVAKAVRGDDRIQVGSFPAGNYVYATFMGDYKNLRDAHMDLEKWMKQHKLEEQYQITTDGKKLGARVEFYMNDPTTVANPAEWRTDIVVFIGEKAFG